MSATAVQTWAEAPAREYQRGTLSELLHSLMWRLQGVTEAEVRLALAKAADTFLRASKAWREPVALPAVGPALGPHPCFPFPGVSGGSVPGAPCCTNPSGMGVPVGLVAAGGPGAYLRYGSWAFRAGAVPEIYWTGVSFAPWMLPPGVVPLPVAYFTVAPGSDEMPEAVVRAWGEAIADGAYALLAMQEGKPWTDRVSAQMAANRFHTEAIRARAEAEPRDPTGQPTVRNPIPFV